MYKHKNKKFLKCKLELNMFLYMFHYHEVLSLESVYFLGILRN